MFESIALSVLERVLARPVHPTLAGPGAEKVVRNFEKSFDPPRDDTAETLANAGLSAASLGWWSRGRRHPQPRPTTRTPTCSQWRGGCARCRRCMR